MEKNIIDIALLRACTSHQKDSFNLHASFYLLLNPHISIISDIYNTNENSYETRSSQIRN